MEKSEKRRAPPIETLLETAQGRLTTLQSGFGEVALAVAEGQAGAQLRLDELNASIAAKTREVEQLKQALVVAKQYDRRADAKARARIRGAQLTAFRRHMSERETAVAALMKAAGDMATAHAAYCAATIKAGGVVPVGTAAPVMTIFETGEHAFGPLEGLVRAEMFRCAPPKGANEFSTRLPFARPPRMFADADPASLRPGIEEFRAANAAVIASIENQIATLNATDAKIADDPHEEIAA